MIRIATLALFLPVFFLSTGAFANIQESVRGNYKIYVGGLSVGNLTIDFNIKPPMYQSRMQLKSGGFVGSLYHWSAQTNSKGRYLPRLQPQSYQYVSKRKDHRRDIAMRYSGVTPSAKITPPWKPTKREIITPAHKRGALDPGAAAMHVANIIAQTGKCNARFKLFEGRSVLSVIVKDQGTENIRKSRHLNWSGSARKCSVIAKPIAGRAARVSGWDTAKPVNVWFAQTKPGAPPIPIKIATAAKGVEARLVLVGFK